MVLVCISCSLPLFWMLAQGKRLRRAAGSIYGYLAERMSSSLFRNDFVGDDNPLGLE